MYQFANQLHTFCFRVVEGTKKIRFDKAQPQHVYVMCLHGRIVELESAMMALLKSHNLAGIPLILRSQLEAFADLKNLVASADYLYRMEAAQLSEQIRVHENALGPNPPPILRMLTESSEVPTTLAAEKAKLEKLRKQNRGPLKIRKRFSDAKLEAEYDSLYAFLCRHSHNNLLALEEHHVARSGEHYELQILKDDPADDLVMFLDISLNVAIQSLGIVRQLLSADQQPEYQQLCEDFQQEREQWMKFLDQSTPAA
jgi:hypothetical protein